MKLVILVTLVALVFCDHQEGHHTKNVASILHDVGSKQAIDYGVPFNAEVIFNPLTKGSQSKYKENKAITITSSSSHSHTFKNKTSHSHTNHGSKPDGFVLHDLPVPHKNVVSFLSHHSASSHFSNRTKGTEHNKNKNNSSVSKSTLRNSNHVSHLDDGSYKPDSYGHTSDELASRHSSDKSSTFDDGSYKPELHKSLDYSSSNSDHHASGALAINDGSYKHETIRAHQIMKSAQHSGDASKYDDGSYKPELYKILDNKGHTSYGFASGVQISNDGSYKHETNHQTIKSTQHSGESHSNDGSHFDNGLYKPELQKSLEHQFNDGSYKLESTRAHQIMKSVLHHDKQALDENSKEALKYDDGLYKPQLYKTIGASVSKDGLYKKELTFAEQNFKASNYDDGSYKPELYKSLDNKGHTSYGFASGEQISNDGSYKHETNHQTIKSTQHTGESHSNDGSHFDNGLYKPELQKSLEHQFNDGSYKLESTRAHQIMKSVLHHDKQALDENSKEALKYDDGLYKPQLYKTIGASVSKDGLYKKELTFAEQNFKASNYDDGSYKPELYKRLDNKGHTSYGFASGVQISDDGSYKHETNHQIIKSTQHTGESHSNDGSHFDNGLYKPELQKYLEHQFNDGSYKLESTRAHQIMKSVLHHDKQALDENSNEDLKYDDGLYKPQLYKTIGASGSKDGLYKKELTYAEQNVKASNYDDGSYKPELYKSLDNTETNTYGFASGVQISNDGSYKHETNHQTIKSTQHSGESHSNDGSHFDNGLYKPELQKSLEHQFNDGSYKLESTRAHQIMKSVLHHDKQALDENSNEALKYDNGLYKPQLYKTIGASVSKDGLFKKELTFAEQNFKASNYDDGSYKPELYKSLDNKGHTSYGFASGVQISNDDSYKHETNHQTIKSTQHTGESHSNDGSHFDNGLYKPELQKSLEHQFNDGSYKLESTRAHQIMKSVLHHDKQALDENSNEALKYDDGLYKPQLYKTIGASVYKNGSDKHETIRTHQIMKSAQDNKQISYASNYDDGSYKPELYKSLDKKGHSSYGFGSGAKFHLNDESSDDGLKPELYKAVSNDGSYKQELSHDHQITKSAECLNKQELYKSNHISNSVISSGLKLNDGSYLNKNCDDGSYKPELYKTIEASVSNDASYKREHDQQIIKSAQHFDEHNSVVESNSASNYDDGSYKPELYTAFDESGEFNDEPLKYETSHDQQKIQSNQNSEHATHNLQDYLTSSQHETSLPNLALVLNDGSNRVEYISTAINDKLNTKPHNEYGIPEEYIRIKAKN